MANVVAYPDISLDKFTGLDPSEDARDFIDIIEQKMQFSLGTRPAAGEADARALYDARKRALFGSVLRGPAAQWFTTVPAADEWPDIRDAFIIRFTDDKDKYRQRIEVENIKRQPNELLKSYIHRLTKAIERGPPRTSRRVVSNIVNLVVNQWLCLSVVLPHCCQPIVLSHVCLRGK